MKYKNNTRYKYQTMLSKQQPKRKRASVTPNSLVRRQFRQWETAKLNRANNIGVNSK